MWQDSSKDMLSATSYVISITNAYVVEGELRSCFVSRVRQKVPCLYDVSMHDHGMADEITTLLTHRLYGYCELLMRSWSTIGK